MRIVFMGTPGAAVPALRALNAEHEVVEVYTRPDKPRGRGLKLEASDVKIAAEELGLRVVQPKRLRAQAEALAQLEPDAICVVAYGALLPPEVLEVPRLGCVNVHFSLLPRWRGAAPVERAILAGDERTGVTTMLMDEGLDTGPILLQVPVGITADDTSGSLRAKLADIGAPLLVRSVGELASGALTPQPQPDDGVTTADKIDPAEAELDPTGSATILERKVRAFDPAPGAFLSFRGKRLKVWRAAAEAGAGEPGRLQGSSLQTADGRLELLVVQPEGKRRMSGEEFARGYRPDGEPISRRL
jgi:methionyl-tRNA formyltransferase